MIYRVRNREDITLMNQNRVRQFPGMIGGATKKRSAVILAGGEGSRLKTLTKAIVGDDRPKQFCPILNERTLLDETRNRVSLLIRPEDTYFSLTAKHARYFDRLLWNVSDSQKVIQPENKGTAPAILYSVVRIASHAPNATIAFFPSDHFFSDDEAFMESVATAFDAVEMNPNLIVLLGIEPRKAETSYGWIEPMESLFGDLSRSVSRVKQFWEKPSRGVAKQLMRTGCLWNSFVMVGRSSTFLEMYKEQLPQMLRMFAAAVNTMNTPNEAAVVRSIYTWIEETNFSSDVLEESAKRLLVMRVGDVGWCDWGEPQRVVGTLSSLGVQTEWMQALAA